MTLSTRSFQKLPTEIKWQIIDKSKLKEKKALREVSRDLQHHVDEYLTVYRVKTHHDLEAVLNSSYIRNVDSLDLTGCGLNDNRFSQHIGDNHLLKELILRENPVENKTLFTLSLVTSLEKVNLSDTLVEACGLIHLTRLPHLHSLKLAYNKLMGDVSSILPRFPALEELDLGQTNASALSMQAATEIKSLRNLNLEKNQEFNNTVAISLSSHRSLEALSLSDVGITYEQLQSVVEIPNLKVLDISFNPDITNGDIAVFSRCQKLEEMNVMFSEISDQGIATIAKLPCLKKLSCSLDFEPLNNSTIEVLTRHPVLEELKIDYMVPLSPDKLQAISSLQSLKYFAFIGDENIIYNSDFLAPLSNNHSLSELYITSAQVTTCGVKMLSRLPALEDIILAGVNINIDNDSFTALVQSPKLTSLTMMNTSLSIDPSINIPEGNKLEKLVFSGATCDDDNHVKVFTGFTGLKEINIRSQFVSNQVLASLVNHNPQLESVYFSAMQIGDEMMETLAKLPELRILNLSLAEITNQGIQKLSTSVSLEEFSISQTRADNDCLPYLAAMKKLRHLDMTQTGIHIDEETAKFLSHSSLHTIMLEDEQIQPLAELILRKAGLWIKRPEVDDNASDIDSESDMDMELN